MTIKKGDKVKILSGSDKGKTGKVEKVMPKEGKILVEGIHIVKKHGKPTRKGGKGQIVEKNLPIFISKAVKVE